MHPQNTTPPTPQHPTGQASRGRRVCLLERESDPGIAESAIATQHHALKAEVEARCDHVRAVCVDDGYSGELPPLERPAIREMLDLADRNEIDYVLATELSRANRGEVFNYYFIRHELERNGVGLEFLDQTYHDDGESDVGALIEAIEVAKPSIERRAIKRRFARGTKRVAEEGFSWVGRRPFGLDYTPGGQKHHKWSKHESEVPYVERIYQLAADGYSREAIAKLYNEEGVPTTRGGKWHGSTVWNIISNPKYKGEFGIGRYQMVRANRSYQSRPSRQSTGHEGKGRRRIKTSQRVRPLAEWVKTVYHPECQIVSAELWQRANDMARSNAKASPRHTKAPRLLKGLVSCEQRHGALERATMHVDDREGHAPRYYCTWRPYSGAKGCTHSLLAQPLEDAVWALVCDLALEPETLLGDFVGSCERLVAQQRRQRARLEEARAQVRKHQSAIDNMKLDRYSGDLPHDEYTRLLPLAEARRDAAQAECERAEAEASAVDDGPLGALADALLAQVDGHVPGVDARSAIRAAVQGMLGQVTQAELDGLDDEGRRRKVRQVVERVEVGPEDIRVRLHLGTQPVTIGNRTSPCSVA